MTTRTNWNPADVCLSTAQLDPDETLAAIVYERACRGDFKAPGFCLIDLSPEATSKSLRAFVVGLKDRLGEILRARQGCDLAFRSLARFDQQATTKFHRDGGPDECFLMLGYEPTEIRGELSMADYSLCAHEMGLAPTEFLAQHNPMFGRGEDLLRPHISSVACFSNRHFQVLLINNSAAPYAEDARNWQGVLHRAQIHNRSDDLRRIVNSAMVVPVPIGTIDAISTADQDDFLQSTVVHRRGYERTHLADDE